MGLSAQVCMYCNEKCENGDFVPSFVEDNEETDDELQPFFNFNVFLN